MARNRIDIDAPAAAIYDVLVDPYEYPNWVVGARAIRGVDGDWPEPGSCFHHKVGVPVAEVRDRTEMIENEPGRRVVLLAKAGPVGDATIAITLDEDDVGTRVTMEEEFVRGPMRMVVRSLREPAVYLRNAESLRRLRRIVETRVSASGAAPSP